MTNDQQQLIIGIRLMQRRKQMGYTQKDFAEICGLTSHQISNIERGFCFPRMSTFLMFCDLLDTPPEYFLCGTVKKSCAENVVNLIENCSQEEQKTLWQLLDIYIHRKDDDRV